MAVNAHDKSGRGVAGVGREVVVVVEELCTFIEPSASIEVGIFKEIINDVEIQVSGSGVGGWGELVKYLVVRSWLLYIWMEDIWIVTAEDGSPAGKLAGWRTMSSASSA